MKKKTHPDPVEPPSIFPGLVWKKPIPNDIYHDSRPRYTHITVHSLILNKFFKIPVEENLDPYHHRYWNMSILIYSNTYIEDIAKINPKLTAVYAIRRPPNSTFRLPKDIDLDISLKYNPYFPFDVLEYFLMFIIEEEDIPYSLEEYEGAIPYSYWAKTFILNKIFQIIEERGVRSLLLYFILKPYYIGAIYKLFMNDLTEIICDIYVAEEFFYDPVPTSDLLLDIMGYGKNYVKAKWFTEDNDLPNEIKTIFDIWHPDLEPSFPVSTGTDSLNSILLNPSKYFIAPVAQSKTRTTTTSQQAIEATGTNPQNSFNSTSTQQQNVPESPPSSNIAQINTQTTDTTNTPTTDTKTDTTNTPTTDTTTDTTTNTIDTNVPTEQSQTEPTDLTPLQRNILEWYKDDPGDFPDTSTAMAAISTTPPETETNPNRMIPPMYDLWLICLNNQSQNAMRNHAFRMTWNENNKHLFSNPEQFHEIIKALHCKKYVFQIERGPETGKLHFQGLVCLHTKIRARQLGMSLSQTCYGIQFQPAADVNALTQYCQKEDTRIAGPWIWPSHLRWVRPS